MKKFFWPTFLVIIGLAVFLLWVGRAKEAPHQSFGRTDHSTEQQGKPDRSPADQTAEGKALDALGLDEAAKERALEAYKEGIQSNVPIRFYGKVIDQFGAGVPGVKITAIIVAFDEEIFSKLNATTDQKVTPIELITNGDGNFSLRDAKGQSFNIEGLSKEGYESSLKYQKGFYYSTIPQNIHRPDPQKPVIFQMWKKGLTEPLIKAEKNYSVACDGRVFTIDLVKRKIFEGSSGVGDLRVQVKRPAQISRKVPYQWTFTIDAVDGGILETDDPFLYRAPDSGYESGYEYVVDPSRATPQSRWSDGLTKKFYLKSRNRKVYASVELEILNFDDDAYIKTKYLLNPAGSRNLEYDPAKKINKQ